MDKDSKDNSACPLNKKYDESLTKIKKAGRPKKINKPMTIRRGEFIVKFQ